MRFYEFEARRIVELAGIPVTSYGFCKTAAEARRAAEQIGGPVVIKSQVLSGGRMKAGGVKFADTPAEAAEHAEAILQLEINGQMPRGVLVDPKAEVKQEYYASVVWDGTAKRPLMLFSDMGGIDIEEVAEQHPDHVGRGHFSNLFPIAEFEAKQTIAATGVSGRALTRATRRSAGRESACASTWRSTRPTPARPTSPPTSSATSPRSTPPTTAA